MNSRTMPYRSDRICRLLQSRSVSMPMKVSLSETVSESPYRATMQLGSFCVFCIWADDKC